MHWERNLSTGEQRVLNLMTTDDTMTVKQIYDVHNAVHKSLTIGYIRLVINNLYHAGLIKRVKRGHYVKAS